MANTYREIGQQSVYTAPFVDDSGNPVDPATVVFKFRTSAGVETTYTYGTDSEVAKTSTGVYTFTAPVYAASGKHSCRVVSTEPAASKELNIGVQRSSFATP